MLHGARGDILDYEMLPVNFLSSLPHVAEASNVPVCEMQRRVSPLSQNMLQQK